MGAGMVEGLQPVNTPPNLGVAAAHQLDSSTSPVRDCANSQEKAMVILSVATLRPVQVVAAQYQY
jgi:hypothetical protein